jgi:hypothetical protein
MMPGLILIFIIQNNTDVLQSYIRAAPCAPFFALEVDSLGDPLRTLNLTEVRSGENMTFAAIDPTLEISEPSWLVRNYITAIVSRFGFGVWHV